MDSNASGTFRFGPFLFDARTGELLRDGQRSRLPGQAATVLETLLTRPGRLVTREELRERLWPNGTIVDFDHGLANAVQRVRDALGESATEPSYVETLPRRGYRFVADVEPVPPILPEAVAPSGWRRSHQTLAWAVAATAAAALVVWSVVASRAPGPVVTSEPVAAARMRVVVLPFENLTADAAEDYFVEGLWDELISRLTHVAPERLAVVARTSAMHFRGARDVARVAHELDVDYALAGSVGRAGERVRVSARLLRMDGTEVWAESFDLEPDRGLDVLESVSRRIAAALSLTPMEPVQLTRGDTSLPAAREAWLRGRWFGNRKTPESMARSIDYFRAAVALDPDYAQAHASLAAAIHFAAAMGVLAHDEARLLTRESAERALTLDPAAGDALAILAESRFRFGGETEGIEELFLRAAALRPQDPDVLHWLGMFLASTGKVDAALVQLERAREIDPLALHLGADYASVLALAGRRDEAMRQLARVRELDPAFPKTYLVDAAIALDEERHADAIASLQRANALSPATPKYVASLAHAYAMAGRPDDARRALGELRALAAQVHVAPELLDSVERDLGVARSVVPE